MHRSFVSRMSFSFLFGSICVAAFASSANAQNPAQEIGFVEQFALSNDRAKTLEQLVPGTEPYYYFHCLHYLTTEQLDKADELLKPWVKRFGQTARVKLIRHRLALLRYGDDPSATLDYLRKELNLNLNHQREIPQTQRNLPTRLDQKLISLDRLKKQALARRNTDLLTDAGLELISEDSLTREQRRHLLQRIRYPDYPGLVSLVVEDLKQRDSGGFGSMNIHQLLTLKQLDECSRQIPKLMANNNFINTYLSKLHPSNDVDWRVDLAEQRAFLNRMWKFVSPLSPKFNSLKASILFRQLELDQREGKYELEKFVKYLELPRQTRYVNPEMVKSVASRDHIVNLNADYRNQTQLLPVQNDESLVQNYLDHFLRDAKDESRFQPYVRTTYLKTRLATTKILNGLGDKEKWASLLTPRQYQELVDRIDLDFVSTNPEFFSVDQPVELELFTKNVQNLIVKIYEINTHNFYRKHGKEVDTDISLDGLVPNHESTYEFNEAPALRIKRSFKLEQITGKGVFVVDFIGNGKSSRALIRKGRLSMIGTVTMAGHRFRIVDESGQAIDNAEITIGGRRYSADENGQILVPFTSNPGLQPAIVRHGNFSCLQSFNHLKEFYDLKATLLVDRESLLRSNETQVLVRPNLTVAGHPVSTRLLDKIQLHITSVNLDGISSTKLIKDLELGANAETVCKFVVPPRLKSLSLKLTAEVKNVSQNRTDNLAVQKSLAINQIDATDEIQDVHLAPHQNGYVLEVLGKTGEPRPKQAVRVSLLVNGFKEPVIVDLQSSEDGHIQLGKLTHVNSVTASLVGGSRRGWSFRNDQQTHYRTIHALAGEEITIPSLESIKSRNRGDVSLLELRRGTYTHDRSAAIGIVDGAVILKGLKPGDYRLRFKKIARDINIRVTQGNTFENVLIGKSRQLEVRGRRPVHVTKLDTTDKNIKLQLANVNDWTRVHVIGTRYLPRFGAYSTLNGIRDIEPSIYRPPVRRSVYMAGRKIGDEYQYILDRKYANKYPGNMLERPSLLLNPWELRSTQNKVEQLAGGGAYGGVGNDGDDDAKRESAQQAQGAANSDFANLDFLADGSTLLANVVPEKDGSVTIDREILANHQYVRFVVLDNFSTTERAVSLPLAKREIRDLRLANAMDPGAHYSQTKQVELLGAGNEFVIEDILSSSFQRYDDLGDVYLLLNTLSDGGLEKFEFILGWPDYDLDKKRELYSRFACHELNFFLMKKDPEFFKEVVAKHLRFKRDKTFVDHWLCRNDVGQFNDPWHYKRLNIFERILLARRFEDTGSEMIRNINETYLLSPTPRSTFGQLFDTSLSNASLDFDDENGDFESRKMQLNQTLVDANESFKKGLLQNAKRKTAPQESAFENAPMNSLGIQGKAVARDVAGGVAAQPSYGYKAPARGRKPPSVGGRVLAGQAGEGFSRESNAAAGTEIQFRSDIRGQLRNGVQLQDEIEDLEKADDMFMAIREEQRTLFRRLGMTKEWVENNYWHLPPDQKTSDRVLTNRFWRDYANQVEGPFLSRYFAEANRNFTEMMLALSVTDLPFQSPEHQFVYDDAKMTLTAAGPMIVMHQQVRPAVFDRKNTTILVSENFFQKNDRYRYEDGVKYDKFVAGEFVAHTLYGAQVVITNPTSTPRPVDLLLQIPRGAIVASGSQETRSLPLDVAGFSTQTFEYFFYFPAAGEFTHFPAHVSSEDRVLAVADPVEFKVIDRPSKVDKSSWAYVSQNGTPDQVIKFLDQENVLRLDLAKIAFRMKDKSFFEKAIRTLRDRYAYHRILWSYGILHNNRDVIREFLSHADSFVSACGIHFESELLTINPIERHWYFHSEFWPLVNARRHRVGKKHTILNPEFHRQYHRLLDVLANRRNLDDDDHLVVTYYLLLQDRVEEALKHFGQVSVSNVESKMQYDYCRAYLAFYLEDPDEAVSIAQKWTDYPVVHWQKRFQEIMAQADEIRGGATQTVDDESNKQVQAELAASAPSFDFEVESRKANVEFQNLTELKVNFYEMDIELLFSRKPFAQDELEGFSMIRPNVSQSIRLPAAEKNEPGKHEFLLPSELDNKNVLVEIVAGDQTKSKPYFSNSLSVQLIETYGQLHVTQESTGDPIAKAYVKVYSRSGGEIKFHKDGYTDLRGRFDYVSQSNNRLDGIEKYSILVMHPDNGAVIKQAAPPAE